MLEKRGTFYLYKLTQIVWPFYHDWERPSRRRIPIYPKRPHNIFEEESYTSEL